MLKCTVHLIGSNFLAAGRNPVFRDPHRVLVEGPSLSNALLPPEVFCTYRDSHPPEATVANGFVQRRKCSQHSQALDRRMAGVSIHTYSVSVRGCDCPA